MQHFHDLTDEQAAWLHRIYQGREDPSLFDHLSVPEAVQNTLIKQGLVRRWRDGSLEITLGGIRQVAHRPVFYDDAQVAEVESA